MKRLLQLIALYAFHIGFVRPVVHWFIGTRFRRRDHIPEGPCIVVSNHNSHLDAALLMSLYPLRRLKDIHPVAAADYFGTNFIRRTAAMALMNGIPIERQPAKGSDPLQPVVDVLDYGHSLIFFPEGSRGEAGVVARFRPGIGRLVHRYPGLLVVPVFMAGPERILPRGESVPVPMVIDVKVGKPRTYSADLDPKEIADQVREDVLSLAPPPPPVPGPRPADPIRVAVCGIDGEARRAVFEDVTRKLGTVDRAIGLTDPVLEADENGLRVAEGELPLTRSRLWPSLLAKIFRTGGSFSGYKFADTVDRARLNEALSDGRLARFVVGDGSALVDLLAWAEADFYRGKFDEKQLQRLIRYLSGDLDIPPGQWWTFVRKAPEVFLINAFDLARPPVPDVLVLLRYSPREVMSRIRSRGRPIESHENERFLTTLQESYDWVAQVMDRRGKVRVVSLEAEGREVAELADEVVAAVGPIDDEPGRVAEGG